VLFAMRGRYFLAYKSLNNGLMYSSMSDDNPPPLSTLGMRVLTRIVRELARADGFDYASADAERRKHSVFPDDIYDEHNRNFRVNGKVINRNGFNGVIDELIAKNYIFHKDTSDGLTIKLNPACSALEEVRQKVYKVPAWLKYTV